MASRPITAKTAWYDFILDGIEASEITYVNDVLTVTDYQGKITKRIPAKDILRLTIEEGPLRNGPTIATKAGQPIKIAGLQKKESDQIRRAVDGRIRQIRAEEEKRLDQEAADKARKIRDCARVLPTGSTLCKIGFPSRVNYVQFLAPCGLARGIGRPASGTSPMPVSSLRSPTGLGRRGGPWSVPSGGRPPGQ